MLDAKLHLAKHCVMISQYTTPNDKVTIIATQPLTKNEKWQKMKNGGYVMFKDGDLVEEIEGTLPDNQSHV